MAGDSTLRNRPGSGGQRPMLRGSGSAIPRADEASGATGDGPRRLDHPGVYPGGSRGCLLIRAGKNHRERSLPLCQEVGDALVAFLKRARPASSHRELFLRWNAPFRPLCSSVSVCTLIQKLLRRAGVSIHRPGAHVLRHSLATQMVVRGATFKEIADVLGHQSLVTTEIYAKLDLSSLSQVAMPWPGGNQ
jgi:site-specific recombinase XerD